MYGGTPYGGVRKSSSASSALLDSWLDGSGTTGNYYNDRITRVSAYAFAYTQFTSISLPNVETVGGSAFRECTSLTSVSLPSLTASDEYSVFYNCTSLKSVYLPLIGKCANSNFYNCVSLESISLPNVTELGFATFQDCTSLINLDIPKLSTVDFSAFQGCTSLISISFPNVTTISSNTFNNCTSLTSVQLPNVTSAGSGSFQNCTALFTICLPKVSVINSWLFYGCINLTVVDMPKASSFNAYTNDTFKNTASDLKLILRNNTLCTLGNNPTSTFNGSTFASTGSGGTLYVPQSLVSAYKNDTKWKQVMNLNANNQILPIEGSPYENT